MTRPPPNRPELLVLVDDACALCVASRRWLARQRAWVHLRFASCHDPGVQRTFRDVPWLGAQLVVVAADGRVWAGPPAFIMCLWAVAWTRPWAERLAHENAWPAAMRFFELVSAGRGAFGTHHPCADEACQVRSRRPQSPYR